jgi:hypothetical protein
MEKDVKRPMFSTRASTLIAEVGIAETRKAFYKPSMQRAALIEQLLIIPEDR